MDLRRNIYLSKPISATPGFGDNIDNEDGYVSPLTSFAGLTTLSSIVSRK
jgi:hypothetical protein